MKLMKEAIDQQQVYQSQIKNLKQGMKSKQSDMYKSQEEKAIELQIKYLGKSNLSKKRPKQSKSQVKSYQAYVNEASIDKMEFEQLLKGVQRT